MSFSVDLLQTCLFNQGILEYSTIKCSLKGSVATIYLNRPAKRNAINEQMGQELVDCLNRCAEKTSIGAVILTGRGSVFCSGGDIDSPEYFEESANIKIKKLLNAALPCILEIRRIRKPVIAAVNGPAIGGGLGLALACDIVIASQNASFSSHYILLGASPDAGVSYFLPRLMGDKRAAWLMFTGDAISASAAAELGLINKVVDEEDLIDSAEKLAVKLAAMPRQAIGRTKELINMSRYGELEAHIEQEKQLLAELALTEDFKGALRAFKKKKKPEKKG